MKTKQQKKESYASIRDKLGKAKIAVFTAFSIAGQKGLSVKAMRDLRMALRPLESEYEVEKKTILDKALRDSKKESSVGTYQGSVGVAYGYGDPYAVAKALYQFAKKNPVFKMLGALMGTEYMDDKRITELAMLPSKEVLLGRLVGMLSYPIRSFAVVLNQIKHE